MNYPYNFIIFHLSNTNITISWHLPTIVTIFLHLITIIYHTIPHHHPLSKIVTLIGHHNSQITKKICVFQIKKMLFIFFSFLLLLKKSIILGIHPPHYGKKMNFFPKIFFLKNNHKKIENFLLGKNWKILEKNYLKFRENKIFNPFE